MAVTFKPVVNDVEIYSAIPLRASREGNPRYELQTNRGNFRTETNAMVNYAVTNYVGDSRVQPIVDLYITKRGTVYAIKAPLTGDKADMLRSYWND